jgi:beta-N-acetylhexosaminidase
MSKMDKKFILIIGILFISAIFLGYVIGKEVSNTVIEKNPSKPAYQDKGKVSEDEELGSVEKREPIKAQIAEMSLDEKIGQLVMVGVDGYTNDKNSRELIEKYRVGGFVLLGHNVKDTEQMLQLINSLKETNSVNKIPLFLSIDEEGGRISRMPKDFVKLPTSKRIGEINDSSLSYQVGSILGEELRAFGLNMNFAPVLDINSNPQNPVIGDRAFGANPDLVTELGIQTMKGIKSQNVISVVKHFPGHGDTSVDSHIGLPIVNYDMKRLDSFELLPFYEAIKNQAHAVMIAHILLPKIDPDNPASFSKVIITDILRQKMNFDGVVITDDLTMGAVVENYDIEEAAVESLKAGCDIILVCHDYEKEVGVINAIKTAVETGEISKDRMDESVYRILKLKEKYAITDKQVLSVDPESINSKTDEIYSNYDL